MLTPHLDQLNRLVDEHGAVPGRTHLRLQKDFWVAACAEAAANDPQATVRAPMSFRGIPIEFARPFEQAATIVTAL